MLTAFVALASVQLLMFALLFGTAYLDRDAEATTNDAVEPTPLRRRTAEAADLAIAA